jgi:hypothetical protein
MHLSPENHYIRYCKPSQCAEDGRILNLAFRLRDGETGLSGDHYEYYQTEPYRNIVRALKERRFSPSPNGRLARLNCREALDAVQPYCSEEARFERDSGSSHTNLYGISGVHSAATEALCSCIIEAPRVSEFIQ